MEKSKTDIIAKLAADMVPIPGKRYSICKYPVTQELWEAVMGENPSKFKGSDRPVENVSWYDCRDFLQRLNAMPEVVDSRIFYRFPKVDELEFACLAGASGDYCRLSDGTEIAEETLGDVAWIRANSGGETHPVGQKKPNAFGLYDMLGNVMHWTDTPDVTSNYCYGCYWDDSHTAHYRCGYNGRTAGSFLGFRLAGTPVPKPEEFAGTDPRWGELLAAFRKFAVHEGWAELDGHDWSEILGQHPEFADKCDKWDVLEGHHWVDILLRDSGAAFADKCDWSKLDSFDWMNLLSSRPEYAEHCDWSDLDYEMLSEDGDLAALLDDQPQLAAKCEWSRIPRSQKAEILLEHPEFM